MVSRTITNCDQCNKLWDPESDDYSEIWIALHHRQNMGRQSRMMSALRDLDFCGVPCMLEYYRRRYYTAPNVESIHPTREEGRKW